MEWERLLVIILGVGFLVLVIMAIVFLTILILIVKSLRRLTLRAEDATEDLTATMRLIGKRILPVALSTLVAAALKKAKRKREKGYE